MRTMAWLSVILFVVNGCKKDVVNVIQEPLRLQIESLFAINGSGSVTLGWTPVINGTASELNLYRGRTIDFQPSADNYYATLRASDTAFVDNGVTNGTFYYYRIVPVEIQLSGVRRNGLKTNLAIGRPFDYATISSIKYTDHIQAIFNSSCAVHACHVGPNDVGDDKRSALSKPLHGGQFSLKSWSDLFEGSKDGAVVIPFKSSKSDMVFHVNSDTLVAPAAELHMPLPGFNLPSSQVRTLIRWIDLGAPNDEGAIAFTYSPQGKIVSVNASEDLLSVIDVSKDLLARYINVASSADSGLSFGSPHHVKVDPLGRYLYATLITAHEMWKFSARTYEFLGKVTIPSQPGRASAPADLALSVTGDTAFVSDFNSSPGRVVMVDTRSMQAIGVITLLGPLPPTLPHGLLLSVDKSKLFTTNSGTGNVSMIRLSDLSQTVITLDTAGGSLTTLTSPYLCDMTPDGRYLFVTDFRQGAQNVYVVDFQRDSTKAWKAIPIGGRSVHVAITPDGRYAYVCNFSGNSVQVIDTTDFSVTTIPNVGSQPHGVAFTPDGTKAYITTENLTDPNPPHHPTAGGKGISFVVVIDVATKTITRRIEVGAWGQGITFVP